MNIVLWIVQGLMALHTAVGAAWKFSHSAGQTMPSLKAIPNGMWLAMSGLELLCAAGLILPALSKPLAVLAPAAAAVIAAEMLLFSVIHLRSGDVSYAPIIYWLVVAVLCALIAYGRFVPNS